MVASHTAVPMGTAKWLVIELSPKYQPAFMVGDMSSPCPLPTARFRVCGVALTSHFAAPIGAAVWLATIV